MVYTNKVSLSLTLSFLLLNQVSILPLRFTLLFGVVPLHQFYFSVVEQLEKNQNLSMQFFFTILSYIRTYYRSAVKKTIILANHIADCTQASRKNTRNNHNNNSNISQRRTHTHTYTCSSNQNYQIFFRALLVEFSICSHTLIYQRIIPHYQCLLPSLSRPLAEIWKLFNED